MKKSRDVGKVYFETCKGKAKVKDKVEEKSRLGLGPGNLALGHIL